MEQRESAPDFCLASELGFLLLNTPGVSSCFLFSGTNRPSTFYLFFTNSLMFPAFLSWDAISLPSTGSDHLLIPLSVKPGKLYSEEPRPRWPDSDWSTIPDTLAAWQIPPAAQLRSLVALAI